MISYDLYRVYNILSQRTRVLLLLVLAAAFVKRRNVLMESVILQLNSSNITSIHGSDNNDGKDKDTRRSILEERLGQRDG
jgi:hypothetical protein